MVLSQIILSPIGFPSTFDYYDFENQTLRYPYRAYEERIKERIDELSC